MDKKQFAAAVAAPNRFSPQDRGWLRAMLAKHPYSSVVSTLALLADKAHGFDTPAERRTAALAMCDSSRLEALMAAVASKAEDTSVDILTEINTFQEPSFKTAPKSVILSNFLSAGPSADVEKAAASPVAHATDDKKSLRIDESLATETLAVILEKQGRLDRALAVYQKLLAENPEKSSTFAARIARLKEQISSK